MFPTQSQFLESIQADKPFFHQTERTQRTQCVGYSFYGVTQDTQVTQIPLSKDRNVYVLALRLFYILASCISAVLSLAFVSYFSCSMRSSCTCFRVYFLRQCSNKNPSCR